MGSDGLFEFLEKEEIANLLSTFGPDNAQEASEAVHNFSKMKWMEVEQSITVDDITCVVVNLDI